MQNNGKISAFSRSKVVIPFPPGKTPLRASCSFNVSGFVCVNVCVVSAARLRHVSMDADGVPGSKKYWQIFQESRGAINILPETKSSQWSWVMVEGVSFHSDKLSYPP
jgi:hypothetical protein